MSYARPIFIHISANFDCTIKLLYAKWYAGGKSETWDRETIQLTQLCYAEAKAEIGNYV